MNPVVLEPHVAALPRRRARNLRGVAASDDADVEPVERFQSDDLRLARPHPVRGAVRQTFGKLAAANFVGDPGRRRAAEFVHTRRKAGGGPDRGKETVAVSRNTIREKPGRGTTPSRRSRGAHTGEQREVIALLRGEGADSPPRDLAEELETAVVHTGEPGRFGEGRRTRGAEQHGQLPRVPR